MNKNNKKLLCLALVAMLAICTCVIATDSDNGSDAAVKSGTSGTVYLTIGTDTYSQSFTQSAWESGYFWEFTGSSGFGVSLSSYYTQTTTLTVNPTAAGTYTVNLFTLEEGTNQQVGVNSWSITFVITAPATSYTYTVNWDYTNCTGATYLTNTVLSVTSTATSHTFTIPSSTAFSKPGMTFTGYAKSATATTATYAPGSTITLTSSSPTVTLYVIFEATSYNYVLTYDANGGTGAPAQQTSGTTTNTSYTFTLSGIIPTRDGYTFMGWATTSSGLVGSSTDSSILTEGVVVARTEAKTVYAIWQETVLTTVSFNANGGEGSMTDLSVLTGNSIDLPTVGFTRDGYYLSAWALGSASGTTYSLGSSYFVTNSVTFYAQWTAIPSDNDSMAPTVAPMDALYRYIPNSSDGVWAVIKEIITSGSIQSSSFPAWMTTHTITYNTLEFAGTPTSSDIGVHVISLTVRASNGYTCSVSWIVTVSDPSEGSIYTVSFNANGGTGTVSSQYGIESSAIELPNNTTAAITKTGYSLGGWSTTIDGTSVIYPLGSIYTIHSDKTFSAVWVADTYVVVFDVNGGTGETAYQTATTDGLVSLPSDGYTKSGNALLGWYISSDPSTIYALGYQYTVYATTVFKAYWVATGTSTINVTFNANGGTGGFTQTVESGKNIVLPVYGINYAGKILSGWNTAANGSGISYDLGSHISITAAKTIYAEWDESTSDTIMITFSLNGGQGSISPIVTTKDSTISKPTDPTRYGYIFNGWRIVGGADFDFTTTVSANMTLEAKWTQMFTTAIDGTTVTVTLTPTYQTGSTTISWGDGHTSTGTRSSFEYDYGITSSGVITVSISLAGDTYASSMNYSVTSSTPAPTDPTPDPIVDDTSGSNDNTMTIIIAIIVVAVIGFFVTRFI